MIQQILDVKFAYLNLKIILSRKPKNHSAGRILLVDKNTDTEFSMIDIDWDEPQELSESSLPTGDKIKLTSLYNVCSDKIQTISSPNVMYRVKDIYDLYLLAKNAEFDYRLLNYFLTNKYWPAKLKERWEIDEHFEEFIENEPELEQLYNTRLTSFFNSAAKPEWDDVFILARAMIKPFKATELNSDDGIWLPKNKEWMPRKPDPKLHPDVYFSESKKQFFSDSENFVPSSVFTKPS